MPKALKITFIAVSLVVPVVLLVWFGGELLEPLFLDKSVIISEIDEPGARASTGKKAPYFELSDINGTRVYFSDFDNTPLILTFWATWKDDAADQIKIFDDYSSRNTQGLFRIVTVNSQEDKSAVGAFVRRGNYDVPVLLDRAGAVGKAYGIETLPTSFFIGRDGIIMEAYTGIMSEAMIINKSEQILR